MRQHQVEPAPAELELGGLSAAAVMALKPLPSAKSRLSGLPAELRARLALAMALDVALAITTHVSRLTIVSDVPELARHLRLAGIAAQVLPDPISGGSTATAGLNVALGQGSLVVDSDVTLAVVADLPCLRGSDVLAALKLAATGIADGELGRSAPPIGPKGRSVGDAPRRWFCPDLSGTGTTVLMARHSRLSPQFEGASAARHRRSGAVEMLLPATARRDVDVVEDLDVAASLGLGPNTLALVQDSSFETLKGLRTPRG